MSATRLVQHSRKYSYVVRLRLLNLPTLKYRRVQRDMIQVYNIVSGKHINQPTVQMNLSHVSNTRGDKYKLQLTHMHYNLRKHFFSNRIVSIWNSLPITVVSAESTNIFENRLDKFWANQDLKFDWSTDIAGIGNCSINNSNFELTFFSFYSDNLRI